MDKIDTILKLLGFIGGLIAVYVALSNKISEIDIRLRVVEKQDDKINAKLDDIADTLTEIKVELNNKQNRA